MTDITPAPLPASMSEDEQEALAAEREARRRQACRIWATPNLVGFVAAGSGLLLPRRAPDGEPDFADSETAVK
jgi:hypothetical protein